MLKYLLLGSLLSACLPKAKSSVEGSTERLIIGGSVVDDFGNPVSGANVYVADSDGVRATTAIDGSYTIEFTAENIRVLENQVRANDSTAYRLYFRDTVNGTVGLSEEVAVGTRGNNYLNSIEMKPGIN